MRQLSETQLQYDQERARQREFLTDAPIVEDVPSFKWYSPMHPILETHLPDAPVVGDAVMTSDFHIGEEIICARLILQIKLRV